jgi:hypothetical protein
VRKKPDYEMPQVYLGEMVLWAEDPSHNFEVPAIVTLLNETSVSLLVFVPGYVTGIPKDGVRHYQHPDKQAILVAEQGCWKHSPLGLAMRELSEAVGG